MEILTKRYPHATIYCDYSVKKCFISGVSTPNVPKLTEEFDINISKIGE